MTHAPRPTSAAPVLALLRRATAGLHERLETATDLSACLRSRGAYAALLARLLDGFAPLEAAIGRFDWAGAGLDADAARWRAPLLRADLVALGHPPVGDAADAAGMPRPATRDAAFGCLYVLEGSALGGQLISRRAAAELGIGPGSGGGFHGGQGRPPAGESWRRFRAALERHCADADAAASAAAAAFAALDMRMREPSRIAA